MEDRFVDQTYSFAALFWCGILYAHDHRRESELSDLGGIDFHYWC